MELSCVNCGVEIERAGTRGPVPRWCQECARQKRNAGRRAYYAANRPAQIAAAQAWNTANAERKKANAAAWYATNTERLNAKRQEWASANPGRDAYAHLRRAYGITPEQYRQILANQDFTCAASGCGRTEGRRGQLLYVDHDHSCCPGPKSCGQCVRGLLCHQHNIALGMCDDDIAQLVSLADYLESWRLRVAS